MPYPSEFPARPLLIFALTQLFVGVALILEDSILYAMHGYALAHKVTLHGAGLGSGLFLILSFGFGLYGLKGEYRRCPVITSIVLSIITALDGILIFFFYVIAMTTTTDHANSGVHIAYIVLYFLMFISSLGQVVVCFRVCCAHRQQPPGVQYVMAPTAPADIGALQPMPVIYYQLPQGANIQYVMAPTAESGQQPVQVVYFQPPPPQQIYS